MKRAFAHAALLGALVLASSGHAMQKNSHAPQAGTRSHAQNYKDMVLAQCVATAYQSVPSVVKDAGSSAGALREWTEYDWEMHPYPIVTEIVKKYLARNYFNPLVEAEIPGVQFDFLKCLDLYHSQELTELVEKVVITPELSDKKTP